MSRETDLNRRPKDASASQPLQSSALPTELSRARYEIIVRPIIATVSINFYDECVRDVGLRGTLRLI